MGYTSVRKCIQIEIDRRYNLIHEKEWTGETVSIICKRYGTSRKTYYKWKNRYKQKGVDGPSDLSRITGTILQRMIAYFIALINVNHIFFGIDSSGFKSTHSSQYYTERAKLRKKKKWIKLSAGADVLKQLICSIKIRRAPHHARHDNIDFKPIITRTSKIKPLSVVVGDKGYDSEENHILVREYLKAYSIIPPRNMHVPVWRTYGRYRKQMKRGYTKLLYNQRNKNETIISVIKRLFGEYDTSRLVRTQNRELSFRCIAYNVHRLTNLVIIVMISTEPLLEIALNTSGFNTAANCLQENYF